MQQYYKRTFAEPVEYKSITFRSKLERDFAMFLDGNIIRYKGVNYYHEPIKWEYESRKFELIPQEIYVDRTERDTTVKTIQRNKKHTLPKIVYTPDFYLPEYDLLVECKGFQFDDALFALRFRLFKHIYLDKPIWKVTSHTQFDSIDNVLSALKIKGRNKDGEDNSV